MFRTCPRTERANPQGWAPGPGLGRLMRRTSMAPSTGTGDTFIVFWCWRSCLHCLHVCYSGTCPPCSRLGCPRWRSSTTRWPPPGWRCTPTRTSASPGQNSEDLSASVSLLSVSVSIPLTELWSLLNVVTNLVYVALVWNFVLVPLLSTFILYLQNIFIDL